MTLPCWSRSGRIFSHSTTNIFKVCRQNLPANKNELLLFLTTYCVCVTTRELTGKNVIVHSTIIGFAAATCPNLKEINSKFFIALDKIRNKLSSYYSLNICFSCRFPYTDSQSFSQYKPLQIVHF